MSLSEVDLAKTSFGTLTASLLPTTLRCTHRGRTIGCVEAFAGGGLVWIGTGAVFVGTMLYLEFGVAAVYGKSIFNNFGYALFFLISGPGVLCVGLATFFRRLTLRVDLDRQRITVASQLLWFKWSHSSDLTTAHFGVVPLRLRRSRGIEWDGYGFLFQAGPKGFLVSYARRKEKVLEAAREFEELTGIPVPLHAETVYGHAP